MRRVAESGCLLLGGVPVGLQGRIPQRAVGVVLSIGSLGRPESMACSGRVPLRVVEKEHSSDNPDECCRPWSEHQGWRGTAQSDPFRRSSERFIRGDARFV